MSVPTRMQRVSITTSWAAIHACMLTRICRFDRATREGFSKLYQFLSSQTCIRLQAYLLGSSGGLGKVVKLDTLCLRLSSASFPTREAFFSRRAFLSDVSTSMNRFRRSSSPVSSFIFSSSPAMVLSFSPRDFSRSLIFLFWSSEEEKLSESLLELRFRLPKRLVMVFSSKQGTLLCVQVCVCVVCTYTYYLGAVST